MNGKQRLLSVLNGEKPDKLPVTLFIQGQGHFVNQLNPETHPRDFVGLQKDVIDFQKELGVDVHARMLFFNPHEGLMYHNGLLNIHEETDDWKIERVDTQDGTTCNSRFIITTPEGVLYQTLSENEYIKGTYMYACTEKPIQNVEDLALAEKYEPKVSQECIEKMIANVQKVKDMVGDDGIVSAWSNGGLFNNISGLIEHDFLYTVALIDEDYYNRLMKFAMKRVCNYIDAMTATGIDAICMGGNVAGGFLGLNFFDDYVMPFEKELVDYIQKSVPVIYHNCGLSMGLVESYKKIGMKNVEPFSPQPLGDGDLEKLLEIYDNKFVPTCSVDQVNVIQKGPVEAIEEITLKTVEMAKKFDCAIIQNTDFLEFGTPIENVKAFAKTALANREY